ncbi:unnamed protein product, partial [Amoebophrya sp. A120]
CISFSRTIEIRGEALRAVYRLATLYQVPVDRLMFGLSVAAQRRASNSSGPLTYTLYVPMRDEADCVGAVGLFVDF